MEVNIKVSEKKKKGFTYHEVINSQEFQQFRLRKQLFPTKLWCVQIQIRPELNALDSFCSVYR